MGQNQEMVNFMKNEVVNLLRTAFMMDGKDYGFKGNFSEKDLEALEQVINRLYPLGHEPLPTTLIPFGVYLGETIIRNIPGSSWDFSQSIDGDLSSIRLSVEAGDNKMMSVMPFKRINNYWHDRSDGLAVLYRTLNIMSLQFLSPENMKEGEWVKFNNGDMVRFVSEEKKNTH